MPTTPLLGVVFGDNRAGVLPLKRLIQRFKSQITLGRSHKASESGLIGRDNGPTNSSPYGDLLTGPPQPAYCRKKYLKEN